MLTNISEAAKISGAITAGWLNTKTVESDIPAGHRPVKVMTGLKQVWTSAPRIDVSSETFKDFLAGALQDAKQWSTYAAEARDALISGQMTIVSPDTHPYDIAIVDETGRSVGVATSYDDKLWADFLDDHLERDENGQYLLTASGAYVDSATGQSADVGQVGGNCYYMTWPTPE